MTSFFEQIRKRVSIAVHIFVLSVFFSMISAGDVHKTGTVTGMVRDITTNKGISDSRIHLRAGIITYCVTTDNTGSYTIGDIPAGNNFPLTVSHKDYLKKIIGVPIHPGTITRKNIDLQPVYLKLLYPNGGESIFAGSELHILWVSVGLASVRLEFSINGGKDWQLITGQADASCGEYVWDVPDIPSTQYLIRITDVSDANITDTSDTTFKNAST